MPTLTVLMGVPGSGKTTWVAANGGGQVVCGTDRLRTDRFAGAATVAFIESLRTRARRALSAGQDVVVDGCNTRRNERTRWRELAHRHAAAAQLVVVHASLEQVLAVQQSRAQPVPAERVRGYHRDFTRSLASIGGEGWARIVHVRRDGVAVAAGPDPARRWTTSDEP